MSDTEITGSIYFSMPVFHGFDYMLTSDQSAAVGCRFRVPFGRKVKTGLLYNVSQSASNGRTLKPVELQLDQQPVLSGHMLQLAHWISDYYVQPLGEVLFHCLPAYLRRDRPLAETRIRIWRSTDGAEAALPLLEKQAPRQHQLLSELIEHPQGLDVSALKQLNQNFGPVIKSLQLKSLVESSWQETLHTPVTEIAQGPALTQDQDLICKRIMSHLDHFQVHVLQGVTGSGKTEVYLQVMLHVLKQGKQVIYLVPEIGLTPQLRQRLVSRLGNRVVLSHSGQTDYQRYLVWDQFRRGAATVMVGTRSALFSQSENLGLVIIDEEHDPSYRQQDGVRYHARDVTIKRAQMLDIPVVLGSATPSVETLSNLSRDHFLLHRLDRRINNSRPPPIELLDISQLPLQAGCSEPLLKQVAETLQQQHQVLLFLNRRGYAPVIMCHDCGWQAECQHCDARLNLHQSINRLVCHHCGWSRPMPQKCPECGGQGLHDYGTGTEQLEQFLKQRFADFPVIRIDRDAVKNQQQFESMMKPVQQGDACILIGTQMLAKGHDYPHITLVGIVEADQALYSSQYRASERLIQTVLQVSGRAGRAERSGKAILQTAFVNHPLMQSLCVKDYSELIEPILEERKMLGFPPHSRAVTVQVDAPSLGQAIKPLQQLNEQLRAMPQYQLLRVIGPIPALMTRRQGKYRAQITLIGQSNQMIRKSIHFLMPGIVSLSGQRQAKLTIEVDPIDL